MTGNAPKIVCEVHGCTSILNPKAARLGNTTRRCEAHKHATGYCKCWSCVDASWEVTSPRSEIDNILRDIFRARMGFCPARDGAPYRTRFQNVGGEMVKERPSQEDARHAHRAKVLELAAAGNAARRVKL